MARPLIDQLQALPRRDLEMLLERRTEARQLIGTPASYAALAGLVSRPEAIRNAVRSLDAFLTSLLHATLWLSPSATGSRLLAQAPGVSPEALRAGADELSRWGLAFKGSARSGRLGSDEWALEVPECVLAAVGMPAGLGPRLRPALESRPAAVLATMAQHLGLGRLPARKEALVTALTEALSDPKTIGAVLAEAPKGGERIFQHVREAGGASAWGDLAGAGLIGWSQSHWNGHQSPSSPLEWLESRGLVMAAGPYAHAGVPVAIPAEVEVALRGGLLLATWPSATPPPLVPEAFEQAPSMAGSRAGSARAVAPAQVGDPGKVLVDLEVLLEAWSQAPPPSLQKGGLGVRELRRSAKALGFPERYTGFLYALSVEAGLVGYDQDRRLVPSPAARQWAEKPHPARWEQLFDTWLTNMVWMETHNGVVEADKVVDIPFVVQLRRSLLEELAGLPPDSATDAVALGRKLAWRHPGLVHCEQCTIQIATRAVEALGWLGTATGPGDIGLLEPGRSAIGGLGWMETDSPGRAAFDQPVSECLVGADLCVIVPGPPVPELGSTLLRFADLQSSSPARVYRISESSLRRALDAGTSAEAISALLRRYAPKGVPQNVQYLIDDVGRRHGQLMVGRAGLYVRADDPALLAEAVVDRRLHKYAPRLLAPTVAVFEGDDPGALLAALRSAGYLPVAEAGGDVLTASPDALSPVLRRARRLAGRPGLDEREAAALADSLVGTDRLLPGRKAGQAGPKAYQAPAPAPSRAAPAGADRNAGRSFTNPTQIQELLELAVGEGQVVEISYVSSKSRASVRRIEPRAMSVGKVHAWCRLTRAAQTFTLARIASAQLIGPDGGDGSPQADGQEPRRPGPRTAWLSLTQ